MYFDTQTDDPVLLVRGLSDLDMPLSKVVTHLTMAAHSKRDGYFDVTDKDVEEKLQSAECLAFAVQYRRVVGFMAVHPKLALTRTDLHLAYIQGVIVHADQRGQRLPDQLLKTALGPHGWPDLVALHTQTPAMAVCVERWGRGGVCFPRTMGNYEMVHELREDLAESMRNIGRSVGGSGGWTGVCANAYPHKLFHGGDGHFPELGPQDALFMVAFTGRGAGRCLHRLEGAA